MVDPNTGAEEMVVQPTQDDPASEEQEVQPGQAEELDQSPESETVNESVPKDNAAWAAMRAENKRLKEAVAEADPEYLQRLTEATAPMGYQPPAFQQVSEDAEYGQVTQAVNQAQQQAILAQRQIAQLQQQIEMQQDSQALQEFPELKSDKLFQQLVAEKKLVARVTGRQVTTSDLAREVKSLMDRRDEVKGEQVRQQVVQQQAQKQVAMATPKGVSQTPLQDDESFRNLVRKGDAGAELQLAKSLIADLDIR